MLPCFAGQGLQTESLRIRYEAFLVQQPPPIGRDGVLQPITVPFTDNARVQQNENNLPLDQICQSQ